MNRVHIFTVVLLFSALLLIAYTYFGLMRHHKEARLDTTSLEALLTGKEITSENSEEEEKHPAILYTKEEPLDMYTDKNARGVSR